MKASDYPCKNIVLQPSKFLLWNGCFLAISWLLGAFNLSIAWICIPLFLSYVIIFDKVTSTTHTLIRRAIFQTERKKAPKSEETLDWLNTVLKTWWLTSAESVYRLIKFNLEPLLNLQKPSFIGNIEVKEFTFGEDFADFRNVKAWTVNADGKKEELDDELSEHFTASVTNKVLLEFDVSVHSPEFKLVFGATTVGRMMSMDFEFGIERLDLDGRIQLSVLMSPVVPLPHVKGFSITFLERPVLSFSLSALHTDMMDVPYLKNWLHSVITGVISDNLVDPELLYIQLAREDTAPGDFESHSTSAHADGVLSVSITGTDRSGVERVSLNSFGPADLIWYSLRIGESQRYDTQPRPVGVNFHHKTAFLISNVQKNSLKVKTKIKGRLTDKTLNEQDLFLSQLNPTLLSGEEYKMVLDQKAPREGSLNHQIELTLRYFQLPRSPFEETSETSDSIETSKSGVVHLMVVKGRDLAAMDLNGFSDPYCQVFRNNIKVKTTPFILKTLNPTWNTPVDVITSDFNKEHLRFVVYDWDGIGMKDDLIGVANLDLSQIQQQTSQQSGETELALSLSRSHKPADASPQRNKPASRGFITVKWCFSPIPEIQDIDDNLATKPKILKRSARNIRVMSFVRSSLPSSQYNVHEDKSASNETLDISIIQAKNLEAKDSNGFSDPFCEIKRGKIVLHRTSTIKKTLNPVWDEHISLDMPKEKDMLEICVWDRDPLFQREFIGNIHFTGQEIQQYIQKCESEKSSLWFDLKNVRNGSIKLGFNRYTSGHAKNTEPRDSLHSNSEHHQCNGTKKQHEDISEETSQLEELLVNSSTNSEPPLGFLEKLESRDASLDSSSLIGQSSYSQSKQRKSTFSPSFVRTMQIPSKFLKRGKKKAESVNEECENKQQRSQSTTRSSGSSKYIKQRSSSASSRLKKSTSTN